jgi:hypothetical protein
MFPRKKRLAKLKGKFENTQASLFFELFLLACPVSRETEILNTCDISQRTDYMTPHPLV